MGGLLRLLGSVCVIASLAFVASAQEASRYPNGPVTIVLAYAAGGPPDVIARILAEPLSKQLGVSVVIDNKPGGSTVLANSHVARANPDGQTLLMVDPGIVVSPHMVAKTGYDVQRDFAWITPLMRSYMTLVVSNNFPANTVQDFVAMAKAHPGEIKYGTSGIGTPPYLGALSFIEATGIDLLHVPYRGVALALNGVISGEVGAVWVSQASAAGQVKGGLVKVLGVYGEHRLPSLPNVPTFREAGVDTHVADQGTWFGVAAPKGTPSSVIAKINAAINAALRDPDAQSKLKSADFADIKGGSPEELKAIVDQNVTYWNEVFSKAGVKPQQ